MGASKVKQNPFLMGAGNNNLLMADKTLGQGPVTDLSNYPGLQSNVQYGNFPGFMQMNSKNPLFNKQGQALQDEFQQNFFNQEELPQLGASAEQQWLGGNLGTSGSSSFGADYMSNQDAAARAQSVMQGQQYYTNDVNNLLNERSNFATTQLQPQLQAQEFNQGQDLAGMNMLNNYNLGAAGEYGNLAGVAYGQNNALANQQIQANAASAMSLGGLASGAMGLIGGGVNSLLGGGGGGGGLPNMFGGGGGGSMNWAGAGLNNPFPASSFAGF